MRLRLDRLLHAPHRLALGLTLAALALRLFHVGAHSYWSDEGGEVWVATMPWPDLLFNTSNPDPPLYRLLLAGLARLSLAEPVLRLPSVLFGAGAVYLMYRWWADLGAPGLGLVAAALLALAPVSVYYSQEVSQYTLAVFMALALVVSYDRAGRLGRPRDWLYAGLASLGALFGYYGVALLFPLLELRLLWQTWRQRTRQRLVGYLALHAMLAMALAVLLGVFFLPQYRFQAGMENAPRPVDPAQLAPAALAQTFLRETYTEVLTFQLTPFADPPPALINAGLALLLLGVAIIAHHFPSQRGQLGVGLGLLLLFFAAHSLGVYPYGMRYALPWLPFLVAFLAAGLWGLAQLNRGLGLVVGGAVLLAFTLFLPNLDLGNPWVHWPREELRPVVQYMQAHRQPGDTVYVYYVTLYPYVLYDPNPQCPTLFAPWFRHWPLDEKLAEMRRAIGEGRRVWFVLSHIYGDEDRQLLTGLATGRPRFEVVDSYFTIDAAVYLLERRP